MFLEKKRENNFIDLCLGTDYTIREFFPLDRGLVTRIKQGNSKVVSLLEVTYFLESPVVL